MENREFNLFKLLEIIALRIKFIIIFVLVLTIIAVAVSLILPKWYLSSTLILPPKAEGVKLGWSGRLDNMFSLTSGLKLPVMATPTDIYARILRSRTLADRVIEVNNLGDYYNLPHSDALFDKIDFLSDFQVTPEGLLEITYLDKNADKAAEIANSFASELDFVVRELASSRAKLIREFIEKRMVEVSRDLDSARDELKQFQKSHKALDLDRQTQLAMESAVALKVDLARNEIDLNIKEKSLSTSHPDVVNLRRRVSEIKKQINGLEFGGLNSSYLSLPISEVPGLKIMFAEFSSRVKIAETLFTILSEQYEQAKIQEKMNTPTISVIDKAFSPELAIKPQKRIIVAATFAIALILAIFIALMSNYLDNLRINSPDDYERARLFYTIIFGWLPGIKKGKVAAKTSK